MVDAALMPIWRDWRVSHGPSQKEILLRSDGMSNCRGCGAEIQWVTTENGKNMPLDADPGLGTGPEGAVQPRWRKERIEDGNRIVHRLRDNELEANTRPLYCSHFETCADRDNFRRT